MGVIPCDRNTCPNIMCHHSVAGRRICTDCLSELNRKRQAWPEKMLASEVVRRIEEFFSSEPEGEMVDTNEEFDRLHREY